MLQSQTRRPNTAALTWFLAVALLVAAALVVRKALMPAGNNLAVWSVWLISLIALLFGVAAALRDVVLLDREAEAISRLTTGADLGERYKDTITAHRADGLAEFRRINASAPHARELLRAQAGVEFARFGTRTRFIASSLLLLAVIGTFVGMKTAIPNLAQAIRYGSDSGATSGSASVNTSTIQSALEEVANAFGSNFLAILGALALGVAAYGAAADRRRLMVSLEQESERTLYKPLNAKDDLPAIKQLIEEFRINVRDVASVSAGVSDLRSAIISFQSTLKTTIEGLQASFTTGFQRNLIDNQKKIATEMTTLVASVAEISQSLGKSADAHTALVGEVGERNTAFNASIAAFRESGDRISSAIGFAGNAVQGAAQQLGRSAETLANAGNEITTLVGAVDRLSGAAAKSIATTQDGIDSVLDGQRKLTVETAAHVERALASIASAGATARDFYSRADRATDELRTKMDTVGVSANSLAVRIGETMAKLDGAIVTGASSLEKRDSGILDTLNRISDNARLLAESGESLNRGVGTLSAAMASAGFARVEQEVVALIKELDRLNRRLQPDVTPGSGAHRKVPAADGFFGRFRRGPE